MCVIFYIAHLGVRYEIYTLALPFDLRCQSGICNEIKQPTLYHRYPVYHNYHGIPILKVENVPCCVAMAA